MILEKNINYIVENDLCIRCGACVGVCPYDDVISFNDSYFPIINDNCYTHSTCTVCVRVCPVSDINLPSLYERVYGFSVDLDKDYLSPVRGLYVGHSTIKEIRERGSSGGVVTQLLVSLLESGTIDGAIVATSNMDAGKPWEAKGILATTKKDILKSAGSKYTIAPVNEQLKALKGFDGKIALVGLPCHIQSYRMWEELSKTVREKVAIVIGVICSLTLKMEAITHLIQKSGIVLREIDQFTYRTGKWPGEGEVKTKDGRIEKLRGVNMIESFRYLSKFYYPEGCLNCVDYAADLADISIGDPWLRGPDGNYLYKDGWSLIAARTEKGTEVLKFVEKRGDLILQRIPVALWIRNQEGMAKTKRRRAFFRIKRLQRKGRAFPNYHWRSPDFSLLEFLKYTLFDGFLSIAKTRFFRGLFLTFMCSSLGETVTRIKIELKSWRYRYKYHRDFTKGRLKEDKIPGKEETNRV